MKVYADPSFIVSLYSLDANSAAAARTMRASDGDRFVTTFGELEVVNAMGLRVFRKEVSAVQAQASLIEFEKDLRDGVFQLADCRIPFWRRHANSPGKPLPTWPPAQQICYMWQRHSNWALTASTVLNSTGGSLHKPFALP